MAFLILFLFFLKQMKEAFIAQAEIYSPPLIRIPLEVGLQICNPSTEDSTVGLIMPNKFQQILASGALARFDSVQDSK